MSIKVDSYTSVFDADIEELQHATLVYPTTAPGGGAEPVSTDYAWQMPPASGVVLADGRVLHVQSIGHDSGYGRHARFLVSAYADTEEDYCTVNNSVDMTEMTLLFDAGATKAHVIGSVSRVDDQTLALVVTTDEYNIHSGDGANGPVWSAWLETVSGQVYGVGDRTHSTRTERLWTIDKTNGEHTAVDRFFDRVTVGGTDHGGDLGALGGLAYDTAGADMYVVETTAHNLYTISLTGTTYTSIGATGVTNERSMAYDIANDILYGCTNTGVANTDSLYTINRATGAWTLVGATGVQYCQDMAYDNTNDILYGLATGGLYTINRATGAWTLVGSTGNDDPRGLTWDNGTLYMTGAPTDPGEDDPYGNPDPSVAWGTVNASTGAFTETGLTVWRYDHAVEPAFPTRTGLSVFYSTDDGVTWQNENMLAFRSWTDEVDDYVTTEGTLSYNSAVRPREMWVHSPTDSGNTWARSDDTCEGNNGIVYRAQNGRYYVTAVWVVRDDTLTTGYNNINPCLLELRPRDAINWRMQWPSITVSGSPFPDVYGEGDSPDYDWDETWIPVDAHLYDHQNTAGRNSTKNCWPSRNIHETASGVLIWTTAGGSANDNDGRVWYRRSEYTSVSQPTFWCGLTAISGTPRKVTLLRMADGNLDGATVWLVQGASTGGIYVGPHRAVGAFDIGDLTQLASGTSYDNRHNGSAHVGCQYYWVTWAKSSSSAISGLRAWTRVPCSVTLPPFQFPHPWHDILKKWDADDQRGTLLLLDENLRAVEEVVFWNAMCGVPEFPHPWGELIVKSLKGDKLWRDCLDTQTRYLEDFLTGTARSAKTPFVFTTRWQDALAPWGEDHLVEAAVDHMWQNFVSWQDIAANPPEDGLCEGEDAGIWRL